MSKSKEEISEELNKDEDSTLGDRVLAFIKDYWWGLLVVLLLILIMVFYWFGLCFPEDNPPLVLYKDGTKLNENDIVDYNHGENSKLGLKTYILTANSSNTNYSIEPANRGLSINNDGVISGNVEFIGNEKQFKLIISVWDIRGFYCSDASTEIIIRKKETTSEEDDSTKD